MQAAAGITVPRTASIAREGTTGGLVGASALAVWFFVVDLLAGHPLYTPAALGVRLFQNTSLGKLLGVPESAAVLVAGYSLVHGAAFVVAGLMIACALAVFEKTPPLLIPGFFFLVVFFELTYYTFVLAFVEPAMSALNWPAIFSGNLIAVSSMLGYFWHRHPDLLRRLVLD